MTTKSPARDPDARWCTVGFLAKLVAQGAMGRMDVAAALAAAPAPGANLAGWRARREWRPADAIAAWQRARTAQGLAPMTGEEAERPGVLPANRWCYLRPDDAGANLAPRAECARWFRPDVFRSAIQPHFILMTIHSADDTVEAVATWTPPCLFAALDTARANDARRSTIGTNERNVDADGA